MIDEIKPFIEFGLGLGFGLGGFAFVVGYCFSQCLHLFNAIANK